MAAIAGSHYETVHLLLTYGADVNLAFKDGSPLSTAVWHSDLAMVKLILQAGATVNVQDSKWGSPLGAAAEFRTMETMQLLLEHGADANAMGGRLGSPLGAAAWSGNLESMKLLLEHGADVNERGGTECSIALKQAIASIEPDFAVIEMLLSDSRARFTAQDLNALLLVASEASKAIPITALVQYGADPNHKDKYGLPALSVAAGIDWDRSTSRESVFERRRSSTLITLLELGANVDTVDGENVTALIVASAKGRTHAVKILLDHKADIYHRSEIHGTAFEAARAAGYNNIVRLLSEAIQSGVSESTHGTLGDVKVVETVQ